MLIEELQAICAQLPGVTEDIKWEHDLCFSVGGKMFLVVGLEQVPVCASFKVAPAEFAALTTQTSFAPAPYLARYNWVLVEDIKHLGRAVWEAYIQQSYGLVAAKLPKKQRQSLGIV